MAESNGFQHQSYELPDLGQYEILDQVELIRFSSPEFGRKLAAVGQALRSFGVSRIILVHGTMAGTDALGWYSHWHRVVPTLSNKLKSAYKSVIDRLAGDKGNFTKEYAQGLEAAINSNGNSNDVLGSGLSPQRSAESAGIDRRRIEVEQFHWTSENHHLGRADAAVRLGLRLLDLKRNGDERVLLMGHSHAGNVFALLSNLIANEPDLNQPFFGASQAFSESSGRIKVQQWCDLQAALESNVRAVESASEGVSMRADNAFPKLDFVTLGTPVRYSWNMAACENLLHFVNHRVVEAEGSGRAYVPSSTQEFLAAIQGKYGDFVQHCFVARTDFTPWIWSWPAWKANRTLRNLLEASELNNKRLWRFQQGKRVSENGLTLLVDYSKADTTATAVAGHSIYTELDSIEFQMGEIAKRFYS